MRLFPVQHSAQYEATRADVTHIILVCLIVGFLSFVVIGWVISVHFQWAVLLSRSVVILITLSALAMVSLGSVRGSARLLIWGLWCANMEIASQNGGLHAPQILAFPVQIGLAGWLLGRKETCVLASLTGVGLLGLLYLEQIGQIPPPRSPQPFMLVLLIIGNLTIATSAALLSRASYQRQMTRLHNAMNDVLTRDAELRKLLQLLDQCPVSVSITDDKHRIEYLNQAIERSRGLQRAQWIGRPSQDLNGRGLTPAQQASLAQAQAQGKRWHGEQTLPGPHGQHRIEELDVVPLRDAQGHITHWFELSQDITDRRWAAEQIERLAYFDPQTQLPNRAALLDHLHLLRNLQDGVQALVLFRLCGLRALHDAMGPEASDRLLNDMADALREILPDTAQAYRLGGGTFAVRLGRLPIMLDEALPAAQVQTEQWLHWLRRPIRPLQTPGGGGSVTLRLGASLYPMGLDDQAGRGLQRASLALSRARREQSQQVCWYTPHQVTVAEQRLRSHVEWTRAADNGQLRLFMQGQYNGQAELVGICAELRWDHPVMGLLPPERFMGLAPQESEDAGHTHLDEWVIEHAGEWLARNPMPPKGIKLTLPLHSPWIDQGETADWLLQRLQVHGLAPQHIRLALSTRHLSASQVTDPALLPHLSALRAAGLELCLQDVGLGVPSPWQLRDWPVQGIHLAPRLVQSVPDDSHSTALLAGLLALCRSHGLRVVAEGVSTSSQQQTLHWLDAEVVLQGKLLGNPMPANEWPMDLLADRPAVPALGASSRFGGS
ncbi:EAL domain-containing protein [Curvibacter sp. HBC28]|uniref:EAL domain-containing protein n=1 Tax=Curvibacter microcysteis TaxID=3026419 RepID=A0ABT5MF09_9BURK|nr:EAL domain-containing protein [Curvibacter sp. HBC28]MDD0815157.1 EAL domain-containing protein [Curvibacter sp. HBC28]